VKTLLGDWYRTADGSGELLGGRVCRRIGRKWMLRRGHTYYEPRIGFCRVQLLAATHEISRTGRGRIGPRPETQVVIN
jgi:hypothetical protein